MKTITILATIELPDVLDIRSEDNLLQDVSEHLSTWRTHDDVGRFSCEVTFASISKGVSQAAFDAGCTTPAIGIEGLRARIAARKEPCDPSCNGWAIFDANGHNEIQRCDACWHGMKDAPDDEDFAQLPEAQQALRDENEQA